MMDPETGIVGSPEYEFDAFVSFSNHDEEFVYTMIEVKFCSHTDADLSFDSVS